MRRGVHVRPHAVRDAERDAARLAPAARSLSGARRHRRSSESSGLHYTILYYTILCYTINQLCVMRIYIYIYNIILLIIKLLIMTYTYIYIYIYMCTSLSLSLPLCIRHVTAAARVTLASSASAWSTLGKTRVGI